MRVIACIKDPIIEKILAYLNAKACEPEAPEAAAKPSAAAAGLFDETG